MIRTIEEVLANHLCAECGTCAGACPASAIVMVETTGGQIIPQLDKTKCTDCGLCHRVCPQIQMPEAMKGYLANPYIGPIKAAYLGQATDITVIAEAQTGGLGRAMLAWSLESGLADAVVCVVDDRDRPLRPKAVLATTPEEVLAVSRSKYCPVPVNALIREMMSFKGRIVYLGLGCHMQGLHLAMQCLPKLNEKIVLKVGLFCDRVLTYAAAEYLIRCAGVKLDEVAAFDYRHKAWRGGYGDPRIVRRNGGVRNLPGSRRANIREFFTPIHCRLCIDKVNALADISLADPHGLARGHQVPTFAIARNKWGRDCFHDIAEAKKISLSNLSAQDIEINARYMGIPRRVDNCFIHGRQMRHCGYELPMFLRTPPLDVPLAGRRPLSARWAICTGLRCPTYRWMPTWVPTVWAWLRAFVALPHRALRLAGRILRRGKR